MAYVRLLCQEKPRVVFHEIETPKSFDTKEVFNHIAKVFEKIGLADFTDYLTRMDDDGASVNFGQLKGLRRT